MSEKNRINELAATLLSQSLRTLINPTLNHALQEDVGELVRLVDAEVKEGPTRQCLHAGLWLLADDLGRAHAICHDIATPYGAAWHAVVHRREGDFWNSKYWWRRATGVKWAGLADALDAATARQDAAAKTLRDCLHDGHYMPERFVDLVEAHGDSGSREQVEALIALQRAEWQALFDECRASVS